MASKGQDQSASLQGLFASLRPSGSRTSSASHPHSHPHPTSRPLDEGSAQGTRSPFHPSAAVTSPQPQASSTPFVFKSSPTDANVRNFSQNAAMSSNSPASAGDPANTERTANLLNLLKFGPSTAPTQATSQQQSAAQSAHARPETNSVHGRGISASDLVGSFMGKSASPLSRENIKPPPSASHQDALLKLLNRSTSQAATPRQSPNPSRTQDEDVSMKKLSQGLATTSLQKQTSQGSDAGSRASRKESPIRYFGTSEAQPTPFEPQHLPKLESTPRKEPLFTYVNPFEQLAASSPRPAKATTPISDNHKRKIKESASEPTTSRRKVTPAGNEVLQSIESPAPTPLDDGRTQVEALMGIGAPTKDAETVAQALNEVGSKVDQEAEKALAKAEARADEMERAADAKMDELAHAQKATLDAAAERVQHFASEVKTELDKEENEGILEEAMPAPVANALKDIIDDAAQNTTAEAWESDNGEEHQVQGTSDEDRTVHVRQFPLKPFVSIEIQGSAAPTLTVRDDTITHIARLRKDFDQTDRMLATATTDFIVYASLKPGLKIIRQDDGAAKQVFTDYRDRIFNVSLSSMPAPGQELQTVLATGVSGAVYWATISRPDANVFDGDLMKEGLAFPPTVAQAGNVSGGQLKTRAKKTSRHPEVFAIGRGKSIHIIFPNHAATSEHLLGGDSVAQGRVVDTDNYLQERNIKIITGKAGKDFAFCEDDSVIVSLDKAGRLKFWDVVDLLDSANGSASKIAPIELKNHVLSFATASSTEKSWPTSVMFVDKLRSYTKGIAQRYVLVGMKQNHTLQLWDLCLLKAVQELNFPHESETDAICSIAYHPSSGIIVVGHPTRNSIYFIHLSAPKYNLPSMPQATFIRRLADKDSSLPRPEATAIMSGLREYSLDSTGSLRSLDLVSVDESKRIDTDDQDPPLFELYVMHSRGVTSLSINKADLGWSKESKVLHPVDAESEKYIVVKDLREPSQIAMSEQSSVNGDHIAAMAPSATPKPKTKSTSRISQTPQKKVRNSKSEEQNTVEPASNAERVDEDTTAALNGNAEKADKKKKKKRDPAAIVSTTTNTSEPATRADEETAEPTSLANAHAQAAEPKTQSVPVSASHDAPEADQSTQSIPNGDSMKVSMSSDFLDKELKKVEKSVSTEFKRVFAQELETLYRRFDDDKRVQSAAGAAKQDAMLRLVSSTLGENVEKSLSRIIQTNIQQAVIPAIADTASTTLSTTLDRRLSDIITLQLHHAIPPLLKLALPEAISRGVQNPDVLRLLSEQLTTKMTNHVDREFSNALQKTIMPAFQSLIVNLSQKVSNEAEARMQAQAQRAESQHRQDSIKIDKLTELVRGLSETVHAMAGAQSEFQQEILKLQQHVMQDRRKDSSDTSRQSTTAPKTPQQEALDSVAGLISTGRYEEGTIQWLQSEHQNYIFDGFLARLDPSYLNELSPLLNLSVSAAVTSNLETTLSERLSWLESVFATINPGDPDLHDVGARIMEVLRERLESGFMQISLAKPGEPALRRIPPLAHQAREFTRHFR
ncbi:MAG: hypothetical protein L6R38_000436 [Xanthoria sp. 2 TBL-2021]|nr:MAG: hypothetical protein L6R38_000436 [Xanthoria sp. 2 TBL-2021]